MENTLSIDPALIDEALKLSGERTKTAVITKALEEFVAVRKQKKILSLAGKLDWNADFSHKQARSR